MKLIRVTLAGGRFEVACLVGLGLLLAGAPGVRANIQPPSMLLVHVQPWDPYGSPCDPYGVSRCEDLTQVTSATGELLVVVYLAAGHGPYPPPGVIQHLDFTLQFGGWWWGDLCANCTDAELTWEYAYNGMTLHFDWPSHPFPPAFMPLCAFWTYANAHDCLQILDDGGIHWGYPQGWWETPVAGKAEAGVECEYACLRNCEPWNENSVPQLTPEELHFEVPQGQGAEGLLQSVVDGYASLCAFDATESWVALEVEQTSYYTHDVRVTVSAVGLAVGEYEARVRETCDARDCSRICLTVTEPSQSVPDDESPPADEAPTTTWGAVKNRYR